MRKLLVLTAVAVTGWVLVRKVQASREEKELWAEVTDPMPEPRVRTLS